MEQTPIRIPGFPAVPFLFPIGLMMGLLAVIAWLEYNIWRELGEIRQETRGGAG